MTAASFPRRSRGAALGVRWLRSWAPLGIVLALLAAAAVGRVHGGADLTKYLEWTKALLSGDLRQMSSPVVSPDGYPLVQHFPGTGALLGLPKLVVPSLSLMASTFLAGGVAALILWTGLTVLLARAAGGRTHVVLVGLPFLFVATHLGFESTAVSSELVSLALIAVMLVSLDLGSADTGLFSSLALGCAAGLLISVRANLAPYVAAVGLVWLRRVIMGPDGARKKISLVLLGVVPLALGSAQILAANHWMTGTWTGSPYTFGDGGFHSVDLQHPHLLGVLLHPWHGLLVYHPLYALLVGATVWALATGRLGTVDRFGWWLLLAAAAATLLLQASWYVWWMGRNTFGGRAFAIWAVVFAGPSVAWWLARRRTIASAFLVPLAGVAALWSYLLLLEGATNFTSHQALLSSVWATLGAFVGNPWHGIALGAAGLVLWLTQGKDAPRRAAPVFWWSLVALYLLQDNRLVGRDGHLAGPWLLPFLDVAVVALIPLALDRATHLEPVLAGIGRRLWFACQTVTVSALCIVSLLFARMWVEARPLPPLAREHCFSYQAPINLPMIEKALTEYETVPGFQRDKRSLALFVSRAEDRYRTARTSGQTDEGRCLATYGVAQRLWR